MKTEYQKNERRRALESAFPGSILAVVGTIGAINSLAESGFGVNPVEWGEIAFFSVPLLIGLGLLVNARGHWKNSQFKWK